MTIARVHSKLGEEQHVEGSEKLYESAYMYRIFGVTMTFLFYAATLVRVLQALLSE